MSRVAWAQVVHAFRRVALPLSSYYAVTLALPLANGAARSGVFMEHALVVLIVPPVAIILACAVHTGCARTRQRFLGAHVTKRITSRETPKPLPGVAAKSTAVSMAPLLGSERVDGIDGRRAHGWNVAGERRRRDQRQGHHRVGQRIDRIDVE